MFQLANKLWRYIKYITFAKKVWQWPRQSDVLIFDACGQEILLEYLQPWNPEILHTRNEFFNVPVFLVSIFRRGRRADAYIDCFIEKVHPKLVVTFIDNNLTFYTISQRHSSVKTMFIQNGYREYYADVFELLDAASIEAHDLMTVDYIMPFGSIVGAEYARHIKGNVFPIGSLKNNHLPKAHIRQNDVIAFVSQWYEDGFFINEVFYSQESFFRQTDQLIIQFLVTYSHKNNKRLMIMLRNKKNSSDRAAEEAYFRELVGDDVVFLEPDGVYPSYKALDIAGVIVGVDSTLVYEAIARGTKAAMFYIRGNLLGTKGIKGIEYGWPGKYADDGPFWTNSTNPENFERILDHLFEINDAQWHAELAEHSFDKVMTYDCNNSILKSILTKELDCIPK